MGFSATCIYLHTKHPTKVCINSACSYLRPLTSPFDYGFGQRSCMHDCKIQDLVETKFFNNFGSHSLLHMLFQLGVSILYSCFLIGCSGNSSFGFCNMILFPGVGYRPAIQTGGPRAVLHLASTLRPIRHG